MSRVVGGRITHPASSRGRPLPDQVALAPLDSVSVVSSRPSVGKLVQDFLDENDEGCLITNVHRHTDQMAHWINAQRSDEDQKRDVAQLLIELGITFPTFKLDHPTNLSWLDASLHIALDKYEFIAVTVSLETGRRLLKILEDDLDRRQKLIMSGSNFARALLVEEIILRPELQLVVLHPHQLLPNGLALQRRAFDEDGESTGYKFYVACQDQILRETLDPDHLTSPPFPPFVQQTSRDDDKVLNVWFVLINADIKFRRFQKNFGWNQLPPSMQQIAQLTIQIVELIYSQPTIPESALASIRARTGGRTLSTRTRRPGMTRPIYTEEDESIPELGDVMEYEGERNLSGRNVRSEPDGVPVTRRRYTFDGLSLEERMALGRDLFSRGSAFRHREEEGEGEEGPVPAVPEMSPRQHESPTFLEARFKTGSLEFAEQPIYTILFWLGQSSLSCP